MYLLTLCLSNSAVKPSMSSRHSIVCDEQSEERSEERKVVSYVGRWYVAFAVTSLQPSFAPRPISPPPRSVR